jgi:uncharacterized Zn finger protein
MVNQRVLPIVPNMTRKPTPSKNGPAAGSHRFDVAKLRNLAGETVFARGAAYHKDGRVEISAIDGTRLLARVMGSEVYRCKLVGAGKEFSGDCSCRAFSDWGFCKHLVATALAANSLGPAALEQTASRFAKIREHLRNRGIERLVEMIITFAERDPSLLQELELAAATDTADDKTLIPRFKKAIAEATRTHGVEYFDMRSWAEGVESVLDSTVSLIENGRAALVLQLLDYFFARMDEAFNEIDDSDGGGAAVYAKAIEIHRAACHQAKPDPVVLARDLFAREVDSDWDFFDGASGTYADILGDVGLAEYRRLANEAWQKTRPRRAAGPGDDDETGARYRLRGILERFAGRDADIDRLIALRASDLSSASTYLGVAQLCLDHGREPEALKWAEEGLWKFEDDPDEPLVRFTSGLYIGAARKEDAERLLWGLFERRPSIHIYEQLKAAAGADRVLTEAVRDRALAWLRTQLGKPTERGNVWWSPAYLLVQIAMMEGLLTEAWAVVKEHGCHSALLEQLAEASEHSHPVEVLKTYADWVEQSVLLGSNGNYELACRLLERMQRLRKGLGETAQHAAYVEDLRSRYKAKRNFIKLLAAQSV